MESKNLATAALVLGIVSLVLSFFLPVVPVITGIIGIVLSTRANRIEKSGMGTAGLVLSIIGLVISVIVLIGVVILGAAIGLAALSAF